MSRHATVAVALLATLVVAGCDESAGRRDAADTSATAAVTSAVVPSTTVSTPPREATYAPTATALAAARLAWSESEPVRYQLVMTESVNYWSAGCTWTIVVTEGEITDLSSTGGSPDGCPGEGWTVDGLHDWIDGMLGSVTNEFPPAEFGEHVLEVAFSANGVPESIEYDLANGYDEETSASITFTPLP